MSPDVRGHEQWAEALGQEPAAEPVVLEGGGWSVANENGTLVCRNGSVAVRVPHGRVDIAAEASTEEARAAARALRRELGAEKTWPLPWEDEIERARR